MKANRFRFRAWVNKEFDDGECHMVEGWLKDQCEWFQLNRNGQELMWGWNEECEEPLLVGRDVTLEFSTGLVDKNGVEEFEGDVVKLYGEAFVVKRLDSGEYIGDNSDMKHGLLSHYELKGAEIIGNVHENPELLER